MIEKSIAHIARFLLPAGPLLMLSLTSFAGTTTGLIRKGNRHYNKKEYIKALENYSKAGVKSPENSKIQFNAGTALYRLEEFEKAAQAFDNASSPSPKDSASTEGSPPSSDIEKRQSVPDRNGAFAKSKDRKFVRDALYNKGNALFKAKQYKQAAQNYIRALLLDPEDFKAKHNLQMALEHLKIEREHKKNDKKKDSSGKKEQQKKQDKQGSKPPQQRPEMSKEDAERILQMMKEKEKSTAQPDMLNSRARKKMIHQEQPEKDW